MRDENVAGFPTNDLQCYRISLVVPYLYSSFLLRNRRGKDALIRARALSNPCSTAHRKRGIDRYPFREREVNFRTATRYIRK